MNSLGGTMINVLIGAGVISLIGLVFWAMGRSPQKTEAPAQKGMEVIVDGFFPKLTDVSWDTIVHDYTRTSRETLKKGEEEEFDYRQYFEVLCAKNPQFREVASIWTPAQPGTDPERHQLAVVARIRRLLREYHLSQEDRAELTKMVGIDHPHSHDHGHDDDGHSGHSGGGHDGHH
jgi:hypothetical protein